MVISGMQLQSHEIGVMKSALHEAAAIPPRIEQTSAMKAGFAACILATTAKGEYEPTRLRITALPEGFNV